jgi:hypothetical protein
LRISPAGAGIRAPSGGAFLLLNSSHICAMVTHSTPSCLLMYSMSLSRYSSVGRPLTATSLPRVAGPVRLPFMHQQDVRPSGNVGVHRKGEHELVVLAIIVVEVILSTGRVNRAHNITNQQ